MAQKVYIFHQIETHNFFRHCVTHINPICWNNFTSITGSHYLLQNTLYSNETSERNSRSGKVWIFFCFWTTDCYDVQPSDFVYRPHYCLLLGSIGLRIVTVHGCRNCDRFLTIKIFILKIRIGKSEIVPSHCVHCHPEGTSTNSA